MQDFESKTLYTDVVMELLTSYILANEGDDSFLSELLMKSIHEDEDLEGPGLLPGLLFSSIIHLTLLITVISAMTEETPMQVISRYGLHYNKIRPMLAEMPQLHPNIVNKIAEMFE
jgi:hypothetical protein